MPIQRHPALTQGEKLLFTPKPEDPRNTFLGMKATKAELEVTQWAAGVLGIRHSDLLREAIVEWISKHIPADAMPPQAKSKK